MGIKPKYYHFLSLDFKALPIYQPNKHLTYKNVFRCRRNGIGFVFCDSIHKNALLNRMILGKYMNTRENVINTEFNI